MPSSVWQWMVAVICVAGLIGCETTQEPRRGYRDDSQASSVLRVGASRSFPPLIFKQDDKAVGIEADFAVALGQALDRQVEFVPMFFPNLIYELQQRRIDIIMSGMSVTPERSEQVAFTRPYMVIGQQAIVRAADAGRYTGIQAVMRTPRRVGVEKDSTAQAFVRQSMPSAQAMIFGSVNQAIQALVEGTVDMVISDSPAAQWQVRQRPVGQLHLVPGVLTQEPLAWAIAKDNPQLLMKVDQVIVDWQASGKLQSIIDRWLPR